MAADIPSTAAREPGARVLRARYRRIMRFATLWMVREWWFELVLTRIGLTRITERGRTARLAAFARGFKVLAIDLGGLMIKVGQFMSSRLDVLPPELTDELADLQDNVPPVDFAQIRAVLEADLGISIARAFEDFDPEPLAAASLGQAHRARLRPDDAADAGFTDVVVKVQRPGIEAIVQTDLAALRRVARLLSRVRIVSSRVDAPALTEEFATSTLAEIDYAQEARALARFAEYYAEDERAGVPEVAWEHSGTRVLTMQDVTGIKINDLTALQKAGIDPAAVASTFATLMAEQVLVHGEFHADPHPGNLFVTPRTDGFEITFIDFGMTGKLSPQLSAQLQQLLMAVVNRDGRALVASMSQLGVILPSADTDQLERVMSALFDRFGGMGFEELRSVDPGELRNFGHEFTEVIRALPFQLPSDFLLLIRATSLTSGVCGGLDRDFNIWDAIQPLAGDLMRSGGLSAVRAVAAEAATTVGVLARLPRRVDELVTRAEQGRLTVSTPVLDRRLGRIEQLIKRGVSAVLFAGLFIGGALLRDTVAWLGITMMSVSALPFLLAVFARSRR